MSRLLIVDDELNVISGLKRQLNKLLPDCKILGANSGKEAIRFIEKTTFDAIVLDIRMPDMDGIELLSLLKTNTKTMHIPVIMLTGCSERGLRRQALDLGAYDFVNKPADSFELATRIKGALRMKSYEDQLREQNKILEQQLFRSHKMELMGLLACSVTHDLNNIFAVISGNASLAARKTKSNTNAAANLNVALESCTHGSRLVQQILQLGRGSESGCELHDLKDIIDESLILISVTIPKDVEIIWAKPHNSCTASFDRTQMIQVMMNLITNAVHAMNGSGALTISLTEVAMVDDSDTEFENLSLGPYSKLSVADTGSGMDSSTLDQIFAPLFTTKPKGKGTGIGLSVVNRIVKKFKGLVTVESTIGVGTTFHVYLPAAPNSGHANQHDEKGKSDEREKTNSVC